MDPKRLVDKRLLVAVSELSVQRFHTSLNVRFREKRTFGLNLVDQAFIISVVLTGPQISNISPHGTQKAIPWG